ncbi:PD-(D/E)XK motif protein [Pseudomonadales bacterium]|nr:PD-(D/E)XK motif protein [Pseudomonadales bacterium]
MTLKMIKEGGRSTYADLWSDCAKGSYPNGRRFSDEDDRFWLSRDYDGHIILFVQEDERIDLREIKSVFAGLTLFQDLHIVGSRFVIKLEVSELGDKFGYVCRDLVGLCDQYHGLQLFKAIFDGLKSWSNFLRPSRQGLSEEAYRGLWGELAVLSDYYCQVFERGTVIGQWVGPGSEPQDYTLGDWTLEVKTTFQVTPKTLKISSLEQLDAPVSRQAIAHVRASLSPEGRSLQELVEGIEKYLGINSDEDVDFKAKVSSFLGEASEDQLQRKVLLLGVECFQIAEGFPRLRRTEVESGIVKANYEIDLQAISEFEVGEGLEAYLLGK